VEDAQGHGNEPNLSDPWQNIVCKLLIYIRFNHGGFNSVNLYRNFCWTFLT